MCRSRGISGYLKMGVILPKLVIVFKAKNIRYYIYNVAYLDSVPGLVDYYYKRKGDF